MRSPLMRRLGLSAVLALLLAVFGLAPGASAASPVPAELTFATDSASTTPGGTVNLSMTITNNKTYDVWFVYQTIEPTWLTTQRPDLKYGFTGCSLATATGSTPCSGTGPADLGTNYGATIPPGQSRTVTLTLQVAADSGCNGNIGFYSYFYAEFSDSTNASGGPVYTPETRVLCA
ncbi:COG1361 family protein [Streptomyces bluensis]|uniref:Secreted protein n=1 Tax=Streptomyces bluensis TaxID=33897 RepID=A0ABW6UKK4_9ACTN